MRDLWNASYSATIYGLAGLSLVLLMLPTVVIVIASLTDEATLRFPPAAFSFRWYRELIENSPQIVRTAITSLEIALWTTVLCSLLGTLASLSIARSRSRLAAALDAFFMSPMILPTMAFGLALLLMFASMGITLSTWTLVTGHIVICTPYVIRMVSAAVQQLNPSLLECSASLGARPLFTFFNVTLPLIRRGIIAGALIAFLTSFDHVPVSLMLADPRSETLPIHLWIILESNLDVRVAAVCGVIVATTLVLAVMLDRTMTTLRTASR